MRWQLFAVPVPAILGAAVSLSGMQNPTLAATLVAISIVWSLALLASWLVRFTPIEFQTPMRRRGGTAAREAEAELRVRTGALTDLKQYLQALPSELDFNLRLAPSDIRSIQQRQFIAAKVSVESNFHQASTPELREAMYRLDFGINRWLDAAGRLDTFTDPMADYRAAVDYAIPVIQEFLDRNVP